MTPTKIVSLSLAQYRMLGRAIRGASFPVARYRREQPTVLALHRKGCWQLEHGYWTPSVFGREVFNMRGAFRPGETVWDSASNEERSAYYRTLRHATKTDLEIVGRMRDRMRAAGELREEPES